MLACQELYRKFSINHFVMLVVFLMIPFASGCGGGGGGAAITPPVAQVTATVRLSGTLLEPDPAPAAPALAVESSRLLAPAGFKIPSDATLVIEGQSATVTNGLFDVEINAVPGSILTANLTVDGLGSFSRKVTVPTEPSASTRFQINFLIDRLRQQLEFQQSRLVYQGEQVLIEHNLGRSGLNSPETLIEKNSNRTISVVDAATTLVTTLRELAATAFQQGSADGFLLDPAKIDPVPAENDFRPSQRYTQLAIQPDPLHGLAGDKIPLTVQVRNQDGSLLDVTAQSVVKITPETAARFVSGQLEWLLEGSAEIQAYWQGLASSIVAGRASSTVPRGLTLVFPTLTPGLNETLQHKIVATYDGGVTREVTTTGSLESSAQFKLVPGQGVTFLQVGVQTWRAKYQELVSPDLQLEVVSRPAAVRLLVENKNLVLGGETKFTVIADFPDGSSREVTTEAVVDVSAGQLRNENDRLIAIGAGQASARAKFAGVQSATVILQIGPAEAVGLQIVSQDSIAIGISQPYRVIRIYSDGTTDEVTTLATVVADPLLATGQAGILQGTVVGGCALVASLNNLQSPPFTLTVTAAIPVSLNLELADLKPPLGSRQTWKCIATLSNGDTQDVGLESTLQFIGTAMSRDGNQLLAAALGAVTIRAEYAGLQSNLVNATVGVAVVVEIRWIPELTELPLGLRTDFKVIAVYSDGREEEVTAMATITLPPALQLDGDGVIAVSVGQADVQASYQGLQSAIVTVTIKDKAPSTLRFEPAAPIDIPLGRTASFKIILTFSDGSEEDVTATASVLATPAGSVQISQPGVLSSMAEGTVTLSARIFSQVATLAVRVTAKEPVSLRIHPELAEVPLGLSMGVKIWLVWSDGSEEDVTERSAIAVNGTLTFDSGILTGSSVGQGELSASYGSLNAPAVTIRVTGKVPTDLRFEPAQAVTLARGKSEPFILLLRFSDGSEADVSAAAAFTHSSIGVVGIEGDLYLALSEGSTLVTAEYYGMTASQSVTVTAAVPVSLVISTELIEVPVGVRVRYKIERIMSDAQRENVTSTAQVTVDGILLLDNGQVYGNEVGSGRLMASVDGLSATPHTVRIREKAATVLRFDPSTSQQLPIGRTIPFSLLLAFTDGSEEEVTSSTDVTVSTPGLVTLTPGSITGSGIGSVTLSATVLGQTASMDIEVIPATPKVLHLTVSPLRIAVGETSTLIVEVEYSDGSRSNVGSDFQLTTEPAGGLVSSGNEMTAVTAGDYHLTVGVMGLSATWDLGVDPRVVRQVVLQVSANTIHKGDSISWTAWKVWSDGVTEAVSILPVADPDGVVSLNSSQITGVAIGDVTIQVTSEGLTSAPQNLSVTPAVPVSVMLTPTTVNLAVGREIELSVLGTWSDGTTAEVAGDSVIQVGNPAIAQLDSINHRLKMIGVGSTTIQATWEGLDSAVVPVNVIAAVIDRVEMTLPAATLRHGELLTPVLLATWSDGATQEVSAQATWQFSGTGKAAIETGKIRAVWPGPVVVYASWQGVSATPAGLTIDPLIKDFRIVNLSSTAFDLLVVTHDSTLQGIRYGVSTPTALEVISSVDSRISLIKVRNLSPSTNYVYACLAGPADARAEDDNNGIGFPITTPTSGIGASYVLTGTARDGDSAPAPGAIVMVSRIDTYPLAAVADGAGFWFVNLGNLKLTGGGVAAVTAGDNVTIRTIRVDGSEATMTYVLTGNSPDSIP